MKRSLFLIFVVNLFCNAAMLDKIDIYSENSAPFNYKSQMDVEGISIEVLNELLKMENSKRTMKSINFMPWTSAYNIAKNKRNTLLLSTAKLPHRKDLFQWVGPITYVNIGAIAKQDSKIDLSKHDDIRKYKIGFVKDKVCSTTNSADLELDQKNINMAIDGDILFDLLDRKMVDLCLYVDLIFNWQLQKRGINPSKYKFVKNYKTIPIYFAFSKDIDKEYINKLQSEMNSLIEKGVIEKIVSKYTHKKLVTSYESN